MTVRHLALPFLLLLFLALPLPASSVEGNVVRVHDGDTLEVDGAGKVRLLGIDTPELNASGRDGAFRKWGVFARDLRRVARDAREYTSRAAEGKTVRLVFDGTRRDRYGRLLAYVILPDGRLLNRLLLEEGLAIVYRRAKFDRKGEFFKAEEEARKGGRGMWAK